MIGSARLKQITDMRQKAKDALAGGAAKKEEKKAAAKKK